MSFEKIGVSGNLKSLVKRKTSLDCLDTWPDQATCEDTHMPIFAEKGASSTEQDVAPDQKEEAKANSCRNSSFRKTIRNKYYLQALELPAAFVKEHGHNFQETVSLQGLSDHLTDVRLSVKSYPRQDRVHFGGTGWRAFVIENGFKVGHQLLFSLVSMSTFTVRLVENSASPAPAKIKRLSPSVQQPSKNIPESNASSCYGMRPPNLLEMRSKGEADDVSLPVNVNNDVVYGHDTLRFMPKVEALLENLRCPHFVTMVGKSNLRDHRSCSLSVPVEFQKKYGTYFSKFNFFQGPSGSMMEVCFSGTKCDRFSKGWKAFHKENGIKLGDVLLFSLRAPGCWLVQTVETSQSEELTTGGELCDIDDSK